MVTFEEITDLFLNATEEVGLSVHPEFWLNTLTLDREFACTLHPGPCEEAEQRASCTVSLAWGPLETELSFYGAEGVCELFHEPDEDCPHLHTEDVRPLTLDLSYILPLERVRLSEVTLRTIARTLKLRASEHSSRAVETRPSISLTLGEQSMETEALTLRQRVELPLWDPEGAGTGSYFVGGERREGHGGTRGRRRSGQSSKQPNPEEWLPHIFAEVAEDIARVLDALEAARALGHVSGAHDAASDN